ncbi:hypothetical protein AB0L25_04480 [Spirillospora sp. NPDC052242]
MTAHHDITSSPIVPGDLFARHQIITGLRALADFLEANPAVPVDEYGEDFTVYTRQADDTSAAAMVDRVAALAGAEIEDRRDRGGHYTATRTFGRISYRIVHIPRRSMDRHDARDSYRNNIVFDHTPDQDGNTSGRAA